MSTSKKFIDTRTGKIVTSFRLLDIKYMREFDNGASKVNKVERKILKKYVKARGV
jgi:hypothetical protein